MVSLELVMIPGFSQTAAMWDGVSACLDGVECNPVDVVLAGSFEETAARIALEGGRAAYAGYSMGGRLALCAALGRPDLVTHLVLVSATAGIADHAERRRRQIDDEQFADWIVDSGREAFLDRWLEKPMFSLIDPGVGRSARIDSPVEIANQLRVLGQGAQRSLWDRLGELEMPVLLISGGLDERYTAIAAEMMSAIGLNAEMDVIPGAGHAAPLELPQSVAECISAFLGIETVHGDHPDTA